MAHKGKLWPASVGLRFYNDDVFPWPQWIPVVSLMSVGGWGGSTPHPGPIVDEEALVHAYTVGDDAIEFRTSNIGVGGEMVEIGWQRELAAGNLDWITRFQIWVDDVTQLAGPIDDYPSVAWSGWGPGDNFGSKKPAATLWATFGAGQAAKLWP